ncbi:MAG: GEVED domain-containing protein [Candidatus Kapaibacterium sp.]
MTPEAVAQTNNPAPYCMPINQFTDANCASLAIGIGLVRIRQSATILLENTSNCTNAGSGTPAYTFFNNLSPALVVPGQTYTYEIQPLTTMTTNYTNTLNIWIDWNGNNVLEDAGTERIVSFGQLGPGTTLTGTFTVPASATGSVRMRIRTQNSGTMTSCATVNYGETEDYTLSTGFMNDISVNNINTSTAIPFPAGNNTIVANCTNAGSNAITALALNYTITPSTGSPISGTVTYSQSIAVGATVNVPIFTDYPFPAVGSANVSVTVSTVNNTVDGFAGTNSASRLLGAGLNGTYTIGGKNPDFASWAVAGNQLTAGGTVGAVTFNVRPGTYTENVYIANIPGNVASRPIIFQSENGNRNSVTLQFSNTAASPISGTTSIG